MNFLLHRHLAARDLGSSVAGLGAMLPDVWRMADRRARARPLSGALAERTTTLGALLSGVAHHLEVDTWFHSHAVFRDGEKKAREEMRSRRVEAAKMGLFAHISWELALDGALLRRVGLEPTLGELRASLDAARRDLSPAAQSSVPAASNDDRSRFDARVEELLIAIARGPWIAGYADGEGCALRVEGVRVRFGLAPFDPADRARVADVFDALIPAADDALDTILAKD